MDTAELNAGLTAALKAFVETHPAMRSAAVVVDWDLPPEAARAMPGVVIAGRTDTGIGGHAGRLLVAGNLLYAELVKQLSNALETRKAAASPAGDTQAG